MKRTFQPNTSKKSKTSGFIMFWNLEELKEEKN